MNDKLKLNIKDINNHEDYMIRKNFLDTIENIIAFVKQGNFTEAAKIMLKEDISLMFLNGFTIRIKTVDFLKLGDEMVKLNKK